MLKNKKSPAGGRASKLYFGKHNTTDPSYKKQLFTFDEVNSSALIGLTSLLSRWLPDGKLTGYEYVARNPMRADQKMGSFKINVVTGRWCDFATGDKGGDPVSLYAYLNSCNQITALRQLAKELGI